jgi:hypothetical protein
MPRNREEGSVATHIDAIKVDKRYQHMDKQDWGVEL